MFKVFDVHTHTYPEALAERAAKERGIPLTIGVGLMAEGSGQIRASYESAKDALEYGAFLKNGGVMWYDEVPETSQAEQIPDRIDYDRMKECIRRGEQDALKVALKEELDAAAAEAGASQTRIRNLMMHIAVRMTDCFRTIYGSMNAFREPADFDFAAVHAAKLRGYARVAFPAVRRAVCREPDAAGQEYVHRRAGDRLYHGALPGRGDAPAGGRGLPREHELPRADFPEGNGQRLHGLCERAADPGGGKAAGRPDAEGLRNRRGGRFYRLPLFPEDFQKSDREIPDGDEELKN